MASKKKQKEQKEDFKQEDILQAVVIADSFNVRFAPITQAKPRALLPLANVPLLDYTLDFLCSAGIEEIIIFCRHHADQIKAHVQSSKWSSATSPCEIITIVNEDCFSVGEALRDIDAKSLIKSDFVLVNGDIVASLKLSDIIEEHKELRKIEKTPVMTMVFKRALPGHRTRCREEEVVLAVGTEKKRILHYQKCGNISKFDFQLGLFQEHKDVQLRYDLLDCHISICSPLVPQLFTENFDYQTRDHFVRGILVNEEILGNTIHIHVAENEYASRVSNLIMYDAVSKDVLNRWSYPLVPDCNITNHPDNKYSYGRHNMYLHKDVTLERDCVLHENVVIGMGSQIGSHTTIKNTVIGKNCHIGKNVDLDGVYIWDGVRIEDGCHVYQTLLDENVHLLPNVRIEKGSILAAGVKVGPDVTLSKGTILMATPPRDSYDDVIEEHAVIKPEVVGAEGMAYTYQEPAESDEEAEDIIQDQWGYTPTQSDEDDYSSAESDMEEEGLVRNSPPPDDAKLFYEEVISTLQRALEENIGRDNLVLEINALKCAYYMQIREVNVWVSKALLEFPLKEDPNLSMATYFGKFKQTLSRFLPLLQNYIKSAESQQDCITAIEDICLQNATIAGSLMKILHTLYDVEILVEEVIIRWNQVIPEDENSEKRKTLRKQVASLIQWLQEAEEESDDDDDDDED